MTELEKVIRGLRDIDMFIAGRLGHEQAKNFLRTIDETITLLKEQEDLGTELTNAVELIHKKNERIEKLLKEQETQKFFVDESGKITPLPVVVRCKDCAYLNRDTRFMNYGYCSYFKDEFYAKVKPDKNFYCGAGKRSVK